MVARIPLDDKLAADYQSKFDDCYAVLGWDREVAALAVKLTEYRDEYYEPVSLITGVPWYFIALVQSRENAGDVGRFLCHLHNGDPLTARTVHEPAGRPVHGDPPFSWETSAVDALQFQGLLAWTRWDVPGVLYQLEAYNGFGYRLYHSMPSPYLWSGSQFYQRGKYGADGKFDPRLVDKQPGTAVVLKYMQQHTLLD